MVSSFIRPEDAYSNLLRRAPDATRGRGDCTGGPVVRLLPTTLTHSFRGSISQHGAVVQLAFSGTDETMGSSLPRDEVIADQLRDLSPKCNGELVVLDAFNLAIAEHGMMHRIANRECRRGNNRRRRLGVGRWFILWRSFRFDHGSRWRLRTSMISAAGKGCIPNAELGQ
jgi:hypothetical protein